MLGLRSWGILVVGVGVGSCFSVLAVLSFAHPWPDFAGFLASGLLGALEGLIISGSGLACARWLSSLTAQRRWRVPIVFGLGAGLHAGLSLVTGMGLWVAPLVGLLATLLGEALDASLELQRLKGSALAGEPVRLSPPMVLEWGLTSRECEVAELLLQRLSSVEIGETLFISVATVKTHASRVYAKTGVRGRRELHQLVSNHPKRLTTV